MLALPHRKPPTMNKTINMPPPTHNRNSRDVAVNTAPLLGTSGAGGVGVSVTSGVEVSTGVCKTSVLVGDAFRSTVGVSIGAGVSVGSLPIGITAVFVGVGSGVLVGVAVAVEVGVKVGGIGVGISGVIAAC